MFVILAITINHRDYNNSSRGDRTEAVGIFQTVLKRTDEVDDPNGMN